MRYFGIEGSSLFHNVCECLEPMSAAAQEKNFACSLQAVDSLTIPCLSEAQDIVINYSISCTYGQTPRIVHVTVPLGSELSATVCTIGSILATLAITPEVLLSCCYNCHYYCIYRYA